MAFPLSAGANPFTGTLTADTWTLVATNVLWATINNDYNADQLVYLTYTLVGDAAPVGLSVPKWLLSDDYDPFDGAATARNIYLYPVGKDAVVTVET